MESKKEWEIDKEAADQMIIQITRDMYVLIDEEDIIKDMGFPGENVSKKKHYLLGLYGEVTFDYLSAIRILEDGKSVMLELGASEGDCEETLSLLFKKTVIKAHIFKMGLSPYINIFRERSQGKKDNTNNH
jgi:hypothetical protein